MAKEMMIVFIYDMEACTAEEDDPATAVLYFHPGWVSDTQRHALAGQVVGTAHCVKSLFSQPLAITLQSGKFMIREYGRYILAIGSDRNIPDWVLKNRASLLTSMIRVYHGDLNNVARQFTDQQHFADKLYLIMETYLPVLQYGCHIFQRVPILTLPKSATSVYLEAMQLLDHCSKTKGVLGGVILYNNKIVSSQLPPGLTSYLSVLDPYRIKSPAETASDVTLPEGSQLIIVYVGNKTYEELTKDQGVREFFEAGEDMVARFRKNQEIEKEKFPTGGMKRDKSLLFTAVPEEDQNMISPPLPNNIERPPNIPDVVPFTNKPRPRPNKLTFKPQTSLDEEISFTGQTSVCGTPMVENKCLHKNVLSICQNPETKTKQNNLEFNTIDNNIISKPQTIRKLASVADIQDTFKRLTDRATSKFKLKKEVNTTINDPSYPVFRNDGFEISESLYKQYLEQHIDSKDDVTNMFTFNMKVNEESFTGFDSDYRSPQRTPKKIIQKTDQSRRKSLSLPLKSLTENEGPYKKLSGVQLTPLMEKLSHLAFSDKSSGYGSRVMTPLDIKDFATASDKAAFERLKPSSSVQYEDDADVPLKILSQYSEHATRCSLLICGYQNTTLLVLMENGVVSDEDVCNLCTSTQPSLSTLDSECSSPFPSEQSREYSFLVLDPEWGTVKRGGPWPSLDIATMGLIHSDLFEKDEDMSEIILRSDTSAVLGNRASTSGVFYSCGGVRRAGPLPPSDALVAAAAGARGKLALDHAVVLI